MLTKHICLPGLILISFLLFLPFKGAPASGHLHSGKSAEAPIRLAIARITHGHAAWIFGSKKTDAVKIVGIYEPNEALAKRFQQKYDLPDSIFHADLDRMLEEVKPEAVAAFGSIYEHLEVARACFPRKIHLMVEKPLATTVAAAEEMARLAKKHQVYLLTNYETSWYPTVAKTFQLVNDSSYVGTPRKVVVHAGHQGPAEIGVGPEFLEWLTDPRQNGGGALIDFGCYGANLMTGLMKGKLPHSVTAITRQYKPTRYPKVDDDATIIINYSDSQCIIQASWNWTFNRKDLAVYGDKGWIMTKNANDMTLGRTGKVSRTLQTKAAPLGVYENPFNYLADVLRGEASPEDLNGLYSMENNLAVVHILEAARRSAKTGKTIYLQR